MVVQSQTKDTYRAAEIKIGNLDLFKLQVLIMRYWFFGWKEWWSDIYQIEYFENKEADIFSNKDWTFYSVTSQECFDYAIKYEKYHLDKLNPPKERYHYLK